MYQYRAKCVHVVDGDTMDFDVDLGFHLAKRIRVRLADIDTPEIYGRDAKIEGELGKKVKDFVFNCLHEIDIHSGDVYPIEVVVATEKTGSFGRWIATVTFANGMTLADKIRQQFPEIK